jgi:hypothetical protein
MVHKDNDIQHKESTWIRIHNNKEVDTYRIRIMVRGVGGTSFHSVDYYYGRSKKTHNTTQHNAHL